MGVVTSTTTVATAELKEQTRALGCELVGVCDAVAPPHLPQYQAWLDKGYHGTMDYLLRQVSLKAQPQQLLPRARSIVAVGLNYNQPNDPEPGQPRIARYALGRDYHKVLRSKLRRLAEWIEREHPGAESRPCVDSAPIFERDYANLAGLGWFGKNTMLINSQRGSWFFIGLLLTSVAFEADKPAIGGCGSCRRCIDSCPTGAIIFEEDRWQIDARRCVSYLTIEHDGPLDPELAQGLGDWTFGCDVCQEVCPFNEPRETQPLRATTTRERDFLAKRPLPMLRETAEIDLAKWDVLTQGSPIRRTRLEGIRRNARINLQNRG
jgi:epoxyqueuosine reductase